MSDEPNTNPGPRVVHPPDPSNPQRPTPGRIVWYQTDGRGGHDYYLPADVIITVDNWVPGDGTVPQPSTDLHCSLMVKGPSGPYVEHNVAWWDGDQQVRRTWRWPERL